MTPLERAARALEPSAFKDADTSEPGSSYVMSNRRRLALERARRVIQAIREPSKDMRYKGCLNHPPADTAGIWRAMIDALLEQGA